MIFRTESDVNQYLDSISERIQHQLKQQKIDDYYIVGIRTGGVWVAQELHKRLDCQTEMGILDISFYRDDFTQNGINPTVKPSNLPFDVESKAIFLIDDVLMSGRTVRAALNELFDYGRPKSVTLATLIDLNARELPIRADITGEQLTLENQQRIKLKGPDPLHIELKEI